MKLNRFVAVILLTGFVAIGIWMLQQSTNLVPESDAARDVQADRLGLVDKERTTFLQDNELFEESEALTRMSDYFYDRYLYPA